jgi:exopolysaccharide production protein ExoZ
MIRKLDKFLTGHFELRGGPDSYAAMEGLRGVAILLVFCAHYYDIIWQDLPTHSSALSTLGAAMMGAGGTGVDLFFVLSGFLIYGAVRKPTLNFRKFIVRRAQRIYPAFLAVFALYLAISPFLHLLHISSSRYTSRLPGTFTGSLLYVIANIAFLPGIFPVMPVMNVAWSLSYEWFFYLSLPLVVLSLRLHKWQRWARCSFFFCSAVLFLGANIAFPATFYFPLNPGRESHIDAVMFVCGILIFEAIEARSAAHWKTGTFDAAAVLFGSAALLAGAITGITKMRIKAPDPRISEVEALLSAALFASYPIVVIGALSLGTRVRRALSMRPIRWLGNMSFSFYLIHGLPLHLFGMIAARFHAGSFTGPLLWTVFAGAFPVVFVVTATVSGVLFLAIEKRFSLTTFTRPHSVPADPASAVSTKASAAA